MTAPNPSEEPTLEPITYRLRAWVMVVSILLGIALLVSSIYQVMQWKNNKPKKKPPPPRISLPFVQTVPVILSENRVFLESGGFVNAKTTAQLSAQVSGKIVRLSPQLLAGKRVKKGEMLVQLGITDYQAAVANAKANLASAESAYQQEQARARQGTRDAKRLGIKTTDLSSRKPQLAAAKAGVYNAEAQLELAETNLARTTINAPFNAIVKSSHAALGEVAGIGNVLATLIATDTFTVKLPLNANELPLVKIGDKVTLTDNTYAAKYYGIINRLDAGFDAKNRTIGAYIDIKQPLRGDTPLLLNDYVNARIDGKVVTNSAWIDNSALVENRRVWRKNADDTITSVDVTVIYRGNKQALVTFTLPVKSLVTRPKDTLTDGQKITTDRTVMTPAAKHHDNQ